MPDATIDKAFILAAGLGTRMRPLTETRPKPLLSVAGRTLLDYVVDGLHNAKINDIVINTHHLAEQIPEHLREVHEQKNITYSYEPVLLDTGGGIKKMLQHFKGAAFYVLSGDGLWTEPPGQPTLQQMTKAWNPQTMDILILLQPVSTMKLTHGVGDYDILPDGRAVRSHTRTGSHMFTSMRINHPRIFDETPDGAFSYLQCLDAAEQAGRLFALEHKGDWHHLSTPEDLQRVNDAFAAEKR